MMIHARGRVLDLGKRTGIVGVMNLTPDSFFAGSRAGSPEHVMETAGALLSRGADLLELGGESTGPGSGDVSEEEEIRRVLPSVSMLRERHPECWIVVDTWKSGVARACLAAGADAVNDVTAGRGDPSMFRIVAENGAAVVLMFSKDASPRTTVQPLPYDDVMKTVKSFLLQRVQAAEAAGIPRERIIVDPGLGHFISSVPEYSFEILSRLCELRDLGPVLVSPSRKSFLAGPSSLPPSERLWPTVAASVLAALCGAALIRTHDAEAVSSALDRVRGLPRLC